jgi:hypothetical protein
MAIRIRRRVFMSLVAGAAAARGARAAEQPDAANSACSVDQDDPDAQRDLQAFRKALQALGWAVSHGTRQQ